MKVLPISVTKSGGPVGGLIQLINFQYQVLEQTRVKRTRKAQVETQVELRVELRVEPLEETSNTAQEATQETTQEKVLWLIWETPTITGRELASTLGTSDDGIKYHVMKHKKGSPKSSPEGSPESSPKSSPKMSDKNRPADVREWEAGNT